MHINSIFAEAGAALKFNRQRSILTTISLAWGVACFVILYSYGDGFHFALRKAFMSIGQDLVLMFDGQTSSQAGGERAGRKIRMERTDRAGRPQDPHGAHGCGRHARCRAAGGSHLARSDGAWRLGGTRLSHAIDRGARRLSGLRPHPQPNVGHWPVAGTGRRSPEAAR